MSQIPIKFQPITVTKAIKALDINQLLSLICQFLTGSIDTTGVVLPAAGATAPTSNSGLFYNTTSQQWMVYDATTGSYVNMTPSKVGEVKWSYDTTDEVSSGWVVCNSRYIENISTLTKQQKTNLKAFFTDGVLPSLTSGSQVGKVFAGSP